MLPITTRQFGCACPGRIAAIATQTPTSGTVTMEVLIRLGHLLHDRWEEFESCERCNNDNREMDFLGSVVVSLSDSVLRLCQAAAITYDLLNQDSSVESSGVRGIGSGKMNETVVTTGQNLGNELVVIGEATPSSTFQFTSPLPEGTRGLNGSDFPSMFDTNFDISPQTLTCSRTRMRLGKLELDDEETALLARQIVCRVLVELSALLRAANMRAGGSTSRRGSGHMQDRVLEAGPNMAITQALSPVLSLLGKLSD